MGNESVSKIPEELVFLFSEESTKLFNEIYDTLRQGVHIQLQSNSKLFSFIEKYTDSIAAFMLRFNNTKLCWEGQQNQKYYFLDFLEDSKGRTKHDYMESTVLIVGFLLYKIYFIENYSYEVNTKSEFQKILLQDEYYKRGVMKVLANAKIDISSKLYDDVIRDTIEKAFGVFKKICWIKVKEDNNSFEFYPAFERIIDKYSERITTIDSWL